MKDSFTSEHIWEIQRESHVDVSILERSIYALALLEALVKVGMPFIFKGGSSLLLLLKKTRRLSTDIDIIVDPGTDVRSYLEEATKIFPFQKMEQQQRKEKNNIEKDHFKFTYNSPVQGKPFFILLDIVYEKNHYCSLVKRKIKHGFLLTEEPYVEVTMPSINCILGDKLTAFAPHTTGICFGIGKELEIIKQLYDIATLIDVHDNFKDVYKSYMAIVTIEMEYKGLSIPVETVLKDTIEATTCIASRGKLINGDYKYYQAGIKGISNHIYGERFNAEKAISPACKVMYMATCILKSEEFKKVTDSSLFSKANIGNSRFAKLSMIRKVDAEAYAYVVKTINLLQE